jgi:hypothetical protein
MQGPSLVGANWSADIDVVSSSVTKILSYLRYISVPTSDYFDIDLIHIYYGLTFIPIFLISYNILL